MVKVILSHEVNNFSNWKKGYDAGEPLRQEAGMKTIGIYNSVENPNRVTVIADFATQEAAKGFLNSPATKDAMKQAGVIGAPQMDILNQF